MPISLVKSEIVLEQKKEEESTNVEENQINLIDNHGNRAEIISALKNGSGWISRYSDTLEQELLYYAVRDQNIDNPNIIN